MRGSAPLILALAVWSSGAAAAAEPWRFEIQDEAGVPTAARVSLVDAAGAAVHPKGAHAYVSPVGVSYFYTNGRFAVERSAAPLRVLVTKGFERPALRREVTPSDEPTRLRLERAIEMEERGWYSGDGHIHPFHKLAAYPLSNDDLLRQIRAEDLNVANLLAANAAGDVVYGGDRVTGAPEPGSPPDRVLRFSEEYRSRTYGHEAVYGVAALSDPVHTGHPGTTTPWDYPTNHDANLVYQAQGAFPSCAHLLPLEFQREAARTLDLRVPECPVDVALGSVHAIEVLGFAVLSDAALHVWERLMNAGFDVVVTAGTDAFLGQRRQLRVGGARAYVQMDGRPFGYDAWVAQLSRGRAFVTNGAMLFLRVAEAGPGQGIDLAAGESRRVPVVLEVESLVPWERLELRRMGQPPLVFASQPDAPRRQRFEADIVLDGPSWIYARLTGPWSEDIPTGGLRLRPPHEAITNAVWVRQGNRKRRDPAAIAYLERWIVDDLDRLERRNRYGSPANRTHVRGVFQRALEAIRARQGNGQ